MNLKRIFGSTLTILDIVGLVYRAVPFFSSNLKWEQLALRPDDSNGGLTLLSNYYGTSH
jgi:hypothetical protein